MYFILHPVNGKVAPLSEKPAKRRGRPVTIDGTTKLMIKMSATMRAAIASRAKAERVTLSEAVRRLIDYALRRKPKAKL